MLFTFFSLLLVHRFNFLVPILTVTSAFILRGIYNLYWHPLANCPGPWYLAFDSLSLAIISWLGIEAEWLEYVVEKYGSHTYVRIAPDTVLFTNAAALKDIYWDPKCNQKSDLYGTGALGPENLFTTKDGIRHGSMRKTLAGQLWSTTSLVKTLEPFIDQLLQVLVQSWKIQAAERGEVVLSDALPGFAADVMSKASFSTPFGFVQNNRDEYDLLANWRKGLWLFALLGRSQLAQWLIKLPPVARRVLPRETDSSGMGRVIREARKQYTQRKEQIKERGEYDGGTDFMQHALNAKIDGKPLSEEQIIGHLTLLLQAGADTTGTALGSTLRFVYLDLTVLRNLQQEIDTAIRDGKLSDPIKYQEVKEHLPYLQACIKETLRLQPPATNVFGRVVGEGGKTINGYFVPPGTVISSYAYIVHRDETLYGPDVSAFRPERWLEDSEKVVAMNNGSFVFGQGPRDCLGKNLAMMELFKVVPEVIRRFNFTITSEGKYVVAGGVAFNEGLIGVPALRVTDTVQSITQCRNRDVYTAPALDQ